ncbi:MAG: hypothetical protein RL757_896 [Bacteroidota bacterium]|jgi:UMF1 family MFS transporter
MENLEKSFELDNPRTINAWAMFDCANSAYALVISVAVFPIYFAGVCPKLVTWLGMDFTSSSLLAYAVCIAYLFVALVSPVLSGIADFGGKRKTFMQLFTYIGSAACLVMFFFRGATDWHIGFWSYVVATIGFAGGLVFNNSFLPLIASPARYDAVSAKGFSFGYLGSTLLLILILVMTLQPGWFGFPDAATATRYSFLIVGLWWALLSLIPFWRLPKDSTTPLENTAIAKGWSEFQRVFESVKKTNALKKYLTAYFFYNAGVQTVIFLASVFAKNELGFETPQLIQIILLLQLVGALGAWAFSKISETHGNKKTLIAMLLVWIVICFGAFAVTKENSSLFYVLAAFVGIVMGGIQSLSRSTYSKLIPNNTKDVTSFFSFFDITDKFSVVFGTLAFGSIDQMIGIRFSMLAMAILFLIGLFFLQRVKFEEA